MRNWLPLATPEYPSKSTPSTTVIILITAIIPVPPIQAPIPTQASIPPATDQAIISIGIPGRPDLGPPGQG